MFARSGEGCLRRGQPALCHGVVEIDRFGDALHLGADEPTQALDFRTGLLQLRMGWQEFRAENSLPARGDGVLLAQAGNRVRANGFTNHLRLNVIVEQEMHLLVLGLLLRDVGLCGGQLLVQRFQLAGVEQVATCLLEAMLCAELLHVVLRLEETVAQCCKLPVHQGADLFRGRDLLVGLIGQVCLGNRLCQTGRLKGIDGGNGDIDDIGLIVARNLELLRKDQKGALIWIVVRRLRVPDGLKRPVMLETTLARRPGFRAPNSGSVSRCCDRTTGARTASDMMIFTWLSTSAKLSLSFVPSPDGTTSVPSVFFSRASIRILDVAV